MRGTRPAPARRGAGRTVGPERGEVFERTGASRSKADERRGIDCKAARRVFEYATSGGSGAGASVRDGIRTGLGIFCGYIPAVFANCGGGDFASELFFCTSL